MEPTTIVLLGLAPGLFWLWIFVRANRQRPDPLVLVIRSFLLGILSAVPIVVASLLIDGGDAGGTQDLAGIVFTSFVVAGLVEEVGKYLVVRLSLGDSPYLDEPLRGLVYAAAVALGFASIENIGYMLMAGPEVLEQRALLSTVGHVADSSLWGYGLGADRLARAEGRPVRGYAFLGLLGSIVLHGVYDTGAFAERLDWTLAAFACGVALCIALFVRANRRSIHRGRRGARQIRCPSCQTLCSLGKRFCTSCGTALPSQAPVLCGRCHEPIDSRAAFCIHCGAHQETEL
ncbi:MAG: PrsW family intramembrane metalloprotease [Myxococcales bacterium]|nr:PrsW family intramembrane metalloprotease [Myxococcales bacterium]